MQHILPGQPNYTKTALDYGYYEGQLIVVYCSGSRLIVATGPRSLVQIIEPTRLSSQDLISVRCCHSKTSRIATSSRSKVYIFNIHEEIKGHLQWKQDHVLSLSIEEREENKEEIIDIAWGSENELFVSTNQSLKLYNIQTDSPSTLSTDSTWNSRDDQHTPIWTSSLPLSLHILEVSPSTTLVATVSLYSNLIKIWRRLSFETPDFDYSYLPHDSIITHVEWRRIDQEAWTGNDINDEKQVHNQEDDDVLFTTCANGDFRVYKTGIDESGILGLWSVINMFGALLTSPKMSFSSPSNRKLQLQEKRWGFVIPASYIASSTRELDDKNSESRSSATGKRSHNDMNKRQTDKHAREHLLTLSNRKADVLIIVDEKGQMSAWGIENVGCKKRSHSQITLPSRSQSLTNNPLLGHGLIQHELNHNNNQNHHSSHDYLHNSSRKNSTTSNYSSTTPHVEPFHIMHINNFQLGFDFRPDKNLFNARLGFIPRLYAAGKDTRIEMVVLTHHFDGRIIWHKGQLHDLLNPSISNSPRLEESIEWSGHTGIIDDIQIADDDSIVTLATTNHGSKQECIAWNINNHRFIQRQSVMRCDQNILIASIIPASKFTVFLTENSISSWNTNEPLAYQIDQFEFTSTAKVSELFIIADPGHDTEKVKICAAIDSTGSIRICNVNTHTGRFSKRAQNEVSAKIINVEDMTFIDVCDDHHSSVNKSRTKLLTCSADGLLRIHTITVLDEKPCDFHMETELQTNVARPTLARATSSGKAALCDCTGHNLSIYDMKLDLVEFKRAFEAKINVLQWFSISEDQHLIAVGFDDKIVILTQENIDVIEKGPVWSVQMTISLPSYCPYPIKKIKFLKDGRMVFSAGQQLFVTHKISHPFTSTNIFENLPIYHPNFIHLCLSNGKMRLVKDILLRLEQVLIFWTEGDKLDWDLGFDIECLLESQCLDTSNGQDGIDIGNVTSKLKTHLGHKRLPRLSTAKQHYLLSLLDTIEIIMAKADFIDSHAQKYLLLYTNHQDRSYKSTVFAYHSKFQDILVDHIQTQSSTQMTWPIARQTRIFSWIKSRETLLTQLEAIARNVYASTDPKDPTSSSLYYLALGKKSVLVNLWRMATWSREQPATMRLLRNNFSEQRWKSAAAKNAYALMGKRRFEYAASFFLLAGDLKSAIGIISNQMNDLELAIAIARVYGGDDCVELKDLIMNKVLTNAQVEDDRYMASWAYSFLGEDSKAIQVLIKPLHRVIQSTDMVNGHKSSYLSNQDPIISELYKHLRDEMTSPASKININHVITAREEYSFIKRNAIILRRMGCYITALNLIKNWDFLTPETSQNNTAVVVTDDENKVTVATEPIKPLPFITKSFIELEANSILDSFDF